MYINLYGKIDCLFIHIVVHGAESHTKEKVILH